MVPPSASIPILLRHPRRGGQPAGGKLLWAIAWVVAGGWASPPAIANPPISQDQGAIASPRARALPAPLRSSQLGLGNLRLGQAATAVRTLMGPPSRIQASPPGNYGHYEIWHYATLTVGVADGAMADLRTTSPRWPTPQGAKVGDGRDRLAAIYGEPDWREGDRWGYTTPDGAYLTFRVAGDLVTEILCGWLPD